MSTAITCLANMMDKMSATTRSDSVNAPRCNFAGKLFILTFLLAMIAETLIYIPSIAKFRLNWLSDRLATAHIAVLALDAAPGAMVPESLARQILDSIAVNAIALKEGQTRRVLSFTDKVPKIVDSIDMRNLTTLESIADAFSILRRDGDEFIRVIGPGQTNDQQIEIVMAKTPLRHAMLQFSANILFTSLFIAAISAGLVYGSARYFIFGYSRRRIGE